MRLATTCEIDGKWGKDKGEVAENYDSDDLQLISNVTKPEHTNRANGDMFSKTRASLVIRQRFLDFVLAFSDRTREIGD